VTIGVAPDPRVEWPRVFLAPSARWRGRGLSALLYPMGNRFVDATGQARFVSLSGPTPRATRGALGVYSSFGNLRMSGIGQGQTFSRIALIVPDSLGLGTIITSTVAGSTNGSQWALTAGGEHQLIKSNVVLIGVSSGARIAAGKLSVVGITYDGTTARFFSDGNACGSATSAQTFTVDTGSMFGRSDNSESINATILGYAEFAGRVLSPSEMAELTGAPGQLFEEDRPATHFFFSSAGPSGTTTLSPSVGGVDVTGTAPALASRLAPTTGNVNVTGHTPGLVSRLATDTADISVTGYAPSVAVVTLVAPATGEIDLSGYVPAIVAVTRLSPSAGEIDVTGYVPTVSALSSSVDIIPTTGSVSVGGYVPTVIYPPVSGGGGRGGNAWHRRLRPDDYLPFLETVRTLRPASGATGIVRGYVPKLSAIMQHDEPDLEIPEEVLGMVLELFEEWDTA